MTRTDSAFGARRSAFGAWRSALDAWCSALGVGRPALAGLAFGFVIAGGGTARAQTLPPDPVEVGSLQVGPLALSPRFEVLNVGVDSNIFNEEDGPKEDFTTTMRPSLDGGLRLGRARLTYRTHVDIVYFQQYTDERALNRSAQGRAELRLARIVPYVSVGGATTRERPNSEIDLRAKRGTQSLGGGATVLLLSRTALVVGAERQTVRYGAGQQFGGEDLAIQLNNTRDTIETGFRLALTPLTTLAVVGSREQVRFEFSPERDSESIRFMNRFEFDPTAIITGTAAIGYRRFVPKSPALKEYNGLVAQVEVRYTMFGRTRVETRFTRDVEYSFQSDQPYYVTTGGLLTVTQQVGGPFDVQVVAGRERLRYQPRTDIDVDEPALDTTSTIGGGVGYRLGHSARLGANVEFTDRESPRSGRSYGRRRIFGSVTYRF